VAHARRAVRGCRIEDPACTESRAADWTAWHRAYEDPGSVISRRLEIVRRVLAAALAASPPGPIRLLSICAGDGRDVLGVLEHHPRTLDVDATLVDLDPGLIAAARAAAEDRGLGQVRCVIGDAGEASWYEAARPIGVLLVCGVFGNISAHDLHVSLRACGVVVAPGGHLVWTRHRRPPDQTPQIRGWLADLGFDEVSFDVVQGTLASVGSHRRTERATTDVLPERLFQFMGDGSGAHT
jgi:ubiquinone/menaquinone biosynthesis C-methylase UbiE